MNIQRINFTLTEVDLMVPAGEEPPIEDSVELNVANTQNAPIFNLAGQQVSKTVKGVYIQNGRKFVVK
ncbi:MAG: hypothetical protein J5506_06900 [Prevotella sp.]|nr:hypothetical protein [Prevotella sp.]